MDNFALDELVTVLSELKITMDFMNDNIMEVANKLDSISDQLSDIHDVVDNATGNYSIENICDGLNSIEDELIKVNVNIDFYGERK